MRKFLLGLTLIFTLVSVLGLILPAWAAEKTLAEAKQRAAKFSKAAHLAALAAATKAQAETAALIEAAKEAEVLANYHATE